MLKNIFDNFHDEVILLIFQAKKLGRKNSFKQIYFKKIFNWLPLKLKS